MDRPPPPPAAQSPPFEPPADETQRNLDAVEWRLAVGDRQYGPTVSTLFAQWITAGRVPPNALVWRTGWTDWRTAEQARADLPAPLPAPGSEAAKTPSEAAMAYHRRRRAAATRQRWVAIGLAVACLAIGSLLIVAVADGPTADKIAPDSADPTDDSAPIEPSP